LFLISSVSSGLIFSREVSRSHAEAFSEVSRSSSNKDQVTAAPLSEDENRVPAEAIAGSQDSCRGRHEAVADSEASCRGPDEVAASASQEKSSPGEERVLYLFPKFNQAD
jgi:hypothetical protein